MEYNDIQRRDKYLYGVVNEELRFLRIQVHTYVTKSVYSEYEEDLSVQVSASLMSV